MLHLRDADLQSLLVPAATNLPSNVAYLAHLNVLAANPNLVRLQSNESTQPPSPRVREALVRAYGDVNLYPSPTNSLRDALAKVHGVDPSGVLIGGGSTELIEATLRAFVRAGDHAVVPKPSWPVYWRRLVALEASLTQVALEVDNHSYHYVPEHMLAAVNPKTKIVIVCTPNNPTGNTMAADDVRRLADRGCIVLIDHAYRDFAPGDDLTSLTREYENVVVTMTFSKGYCLAGLRLGYMIGSASVLDYVDRFLVPGSAVSSIALHVGLAALGDTEYHQRQIERIVSERDRLIAAARSFGLRAFDSHGNFVAMDVTGFPGGPKQFVAAILEHGVLIRAMDDTLVRMTVGTREENDALIDALQAVAEIRG